MAVGRVLKGYKRTIYFDFRDEAGPIMTIYLVGYLGGRPTTTTFLNVASPHVHRAQENCKLLISELLRISESPVHADRSVSSSEYDSCSGELK